MSETAPTQVPVPILDPNTDQYVQHITVSPPAYSKMQNTAKKYAYNGGFTLPELADVDPVAAYEVAENGLAVDALRKGRRQVTTDTGHTISIEQDGRHAAFREARNNIRSQLKGAPAPDRVEVNVARRLLPARRAPKHVATINLRRPPTDLVA